MIIQVCPRCSGDGFYTIPLERMWPEMNVATARRVYVDGVTVPACSGWSYPKEVAAYRFDCFKCDGRGDTTWSRGKSLTPIGA